MTHYYVSCFRFTIFVDVSQDGIVVDTAPVARRFVGQPFAALLRWLSEFGGVTTGRGTDTGVVVEVLNE